MEYQTLLFHVVLILFTAKLAGAVAKRMGQPAVLGELLCGICLGPSLFGIIKPDEALKFIGNMGIILVMFLSGLETDPEKLHRIGKPASFAAFGGAILPMVLGSGIAFGFGYTFSESIFIGVVLMATSVGITAQTLMELGKLKTKEATTILTAAIIDDLLGIFILSLVIGFAKRGVFSFSEILTIALKISVFFFFSIYIGLRLLPHLFKWLTRLPVSEIVVSSAIGICLFYSFAAESLGGMAEIIGAYIAGVLLGRMGTYQDVLKEKLHSFTYAFFAPVFFVGIGLEAQIKGIGALWLFTLLIVLAAVIGKVFGCGVCAKLAGFNLKESLRVGVGMMSRGEVALIVTSVGMHSGILSKEVFSVMVIMIFLTTFATPPLLKFLFKKE